MRKSESFTHNQAKEKLTIRFQKYLTLRQVYQETLKSNIDNFFSKQQQQHYGRIIFIFVVSHNHQTWKQIIRLFSLRKTFQDLHNFQYAIRKKYKEIPKFPLSKDDEDKLDPKLLTIFIDFLRAFIKSVNEVAYDDSLFTSFVNLFPDKIGTNLLKKVMESSTVNFLFLNVQEEDTIKRLASKNVITICFPVAEYGDTGIFYSQKSNSFEIKDLLLYCFKFTMYYGIVRTGKQLGIVLEASTRRLNLQAQEFHILILFIVAIKEAIDNSVFADHKRQKLEKFGSFAPIRQNCSTKFYIDGKGYFEDLYEQLKKAQKYVYITGWMITPYFMLKRPNLLLNREYRFDGILEELAKRNVKIYIIIYQQPKIAINNDSQFVKKYLEEIGRNNIKVMRHPNYIVIPFLWSHHEKIILIDQKVAFLGGFDICYGRWDTQKHLLSNPNQEMYWEGADFCNLRIRDIYKPRDYMMSNLTYSEPKMPWHDVAVQIQGPSVNDIARHFTNYWNFVNFQTKITDDRQLLNLAGLKAQNTVSKFAAVKNFFKKLSFFKKKTKIEPTIQMTHVPINNTQNNSQNARNFRNNVKNDSEKERERSPDLTINSPGLKIPISGRKRSVTVQQRDSLDSNRSMNNSSRSSIRRKSSIQEEFYDKFMKKEEENPSRSISNFFKSPIKFFGFLKDNQDENLMISNENWNTNTGKHIHLVLRSSSTWSSGLSETELSIHEAYLNLIKQAKKFIYIQNQFFIARENLVIEQIAKRILLAFRNKEDFKVIVFIPLLPGFEGDVRESNSTVMRIQLLLEYQTICRANDSLFSQLKNGFMKSEDIDNYIKFYSLRQHGVIGDIPVTEILYIHSKLMIVDDEKMIIGSANINDRSLLGDRDSQIAILIEETSKVSPQYNKLNSFKDIISFRISLLKEHFDISDSDAEKFHTEVVWKELKYIAKRNTEIYRYVFGCYPDDKMRKYSDIDKIEKSTVEQRCNRYKEEKDNIRGHAVELPLHFLEEENLEIQVTEKQFILPDFFFT